MAESGHETRFTDLPAILPIFPLPGALLLPRGRLPLNIFEPRYLHMVEDALGNGRMIGMVQPAGGPSAETPDLPIADGIPVYPIGCAGRITAFAEAEGGRFVITLTGIARFAIAEELPPARGYRRIRPDWSGFRNDLAGEEPPLIDRPRLITAMERFFGLNGIAADWDSVGRTPDEKLVTSLAMMCPFSPSEKQALLEAPDSTERSRIIIALMEIGALEDGNAARH